MCSLVLRCFICYLLFSFLLCSASAGKSSAAKRVLVVLQDAEVQKRHALFFEDLKSVGFSLTFKKPIDAGPALLRWGEYQFDNLILFAPQATAFGVKGGHKEFLDFVDSGRNVLLIGNTRLSKRVFELASDLGSDFESQGSLLFDHIQYAKLQTKDDEKMIKTDHSVLVVEPEMQIRHLFNKRKKSINSSPLLYHGIGHSLSPESEYFTVAVTGASTSYSYTANQDPINENQMLVGKDTNLVSLMQTVNNGRVAIVGSLEFFSDHFFTTPFITARNQQQYDASGNREFCQDLVLWTFQKIGVLQAQTPRHYNTKTGLKPTMYTIMDPIRFELDISELVIDRWIPYHSDSVRLEYYMMDPYIRSFLKDHGNGTFGLDLIAPDVYGVFKFLVMHKMPGYSNIDIVEMAPIRPFRHNEFERFILTAYPYYVSVFSMMAGFWIFGILFLYHK